MGSSWWRAALEAGALTARIACLAERPFPRAEFQKRYREAFGEPWKPRRCDFKLAGTKWWLLPGARAMALSEDGMVTLYRAPGSGPTVVSRLASALAEWGSAVANSKRG